MPTTRRTKDPVHAAPARRVDELEAVLRSYRGKQLLIVLTGVPDPDCIASAWALRYLAAELEVEAVILHVSKLSHQENRALVKTMDIPLVMYHDKFDLAPFKAYAMVDAPAPLGQSKLAEGLDRLPLAVVVDHHKRDAEVKAQFVDIRENAGSTASIMAEYLREGTVQLELGRVEDGQIATALLHGIRTDTDSYFSALEIDFVASAFLAPFADSDLLKLVSTQLVPAKIMDIMQKAMENKLIRENYLLAGVGYVRPEDRDAIPQAADFLVRREAVDTTVVFGIVDDKYIEGSLRTRSRMLDPDQFLKQLLGNDSQGKSYGGGRLDKGGFKIPVGMFAACSDKDLLWEMTKRTLTELFFGALGLSPTA
jgi:nanoRNase/pAp phosphatase (c-di-AMP/oligoRNAs hydrolase)